MKAVFFQSKPFTPLQATVAILLILLGGSVYVYFSMAKQLTATKSQLVSDTAAFKAQISELQESFAQAQNENTNLAEALRVEQGKNDYFDFQLKSITGTVGTLQKLSMTDPELLKKYSKVYFLNENYIPATLTDITNSEYAYRNGKTISIQTSVWLYLAKLLNDAKANSVPLQIISGYRSFAEQSSLKSNYKVTYGSGANQFSADQGYSEHQLGTTVDFTTPDLGASFNTFKNTAAYIWLTQNAYKYGFVLSYSENNLYYQFEPWHWRFVGVTLATKLHDENKYFYDLDQREIDKYLINLFD
ncbi:MAG: M15 family metallopeptidase [bacterium]|nr:M15 family metallopeptidase [bacterium]